MKPGLLFSIKLGLAFLGKSAHTLLGMGQLGGRCHHLDSVAVGFGLVQVNLGIKRLLADTLGNSAAPGSRVEQPLRLVNQFIRRDHPVDQTPFVGSAGVNPVVCDPRSG